MKNLLLFFLILTPFVGIEQAVPSKEENIPYLVTFGKDGSPNWGDDDFTQTFFFTIPKTYKNPFFIRVFDPGTSGEIDEKKGSFNTTTKFSVYGGKGCISSDIAKSTQPVPEKYRGTLLAKKSFSTEYDNKWYTFGPFNPTSGELALEFRGNVFKIIAEGIEGDDGNLYRYFLSTSPSSNIAVEGGNAFTFEYSFRLNNDATEVSHVYPYVDQNVLSIEQRNFDWDDDGELKVITNRRLAVYLKKSGEGTWRSSKHVVLQEEKGSSFDVQFHKNKGKFINNNNITFYITNNYGKALPFYTVPIGGAPKPKSSIKLTPKN